mmetsp:Transcript_18840/g.41454  ORF Transcript_18840/g.41454 Transcript_18840/m.41454 type:complete len:221 (+) Transcript_18840:350-1012(+)
MRSSGPAEGAGCKSSRSSTRSSLVFGVSAAAAFTAGGREFVLEMCNSSRSTLESCVTTAGLGERCRLEVDGKTAWPPPWRPRLPEALEGLEGLRLPARSSSRGTFKVALDTPVFRSLSGMESADMGLGRETGGPLSASSSVLARQGSGGAEDPLAATLLRSAGAMGGVGRASRTSISGEACLSVFSPVTEGEDPSSSSNFTSCFCSGDPGPDCGGVALSA